MVSLAGFGQDVKEVLLLLAAFFIVAVVFTAMTTHDSNIFAHGYNILNKVFFTPAAGINQQSCAKIFDGFSTIQTTTLGSGSNALTLLFGTIINTVIVLLNLVVGILVFIVNVILGCGIGIVFLLLGLGIVGIVVYYFFRTLSYIFG